jgi:hypothetical protein
MPAIHLTAHHFAPCDDFRPWERGRSPAHGADPLAAGCTAAHSSLSVRRGYHRRLRQLGSKFVRGRAVRIGRPGRDNGSA